MTQDFRKGKIYKITNDYNDDVYVGSTCDTLVKRFSSHKKNANQHKNRTFSVLINEIGFDRFRIELIENFPCEDKYQLRQREGYYIREIGTLNMLVAGRTSQESNKLGEETEAIKETRKQYRENVCKQVHICECGCEIHRHSLSAHLNTKKHLKLLQQQLALQAV
jgi:group I intron endonuclease